MFTRNPGGPAFEEQDVAVAEELAARTAVCIDNARLYARERRTALTLQSSLLPADLHTPLGMEIASRISAGERPDGGRGRLVRRHPAARVPGGARGGRRHGAQEPAPRPTMGQLRTAARTLASLDLPPDEVLFRLNRMSQDLDPTQIATAVYATYDPVHPDLRAGAGGARAAGADLSRRVAREIIELPSGLPLGIGASRWRRWRWCCRPVGCSAFYTDGLVESRDRDIDLGIMALRRLLSGPSQDLEEMCDVTINSQRPGHERDDIALLLARVHELAPDEIASCSLPADPRFVSHARRFVRATLAEWGLGLGLRHHRAGGQRAGDQRAQARLAADRAEVAEGPGPHPGL